MGTWEYIRAILQALGNRLTAHADALYHFLVPATGVVLVLLGLILLLIAVQTRWRPLRVFISYKHAYQDIADEIRRFLHQQGRVFKVEMLDFQERSHDQTIAEVRRMIRHSDMMICIPDPANPSFVNAEILAMSVLQKPIVLIRHQKEQLLPHTALSGYPVLLADALRKRKFHPLAAYCRFIGRHYSDLKRLGQRLLPALIVVELVKDFRVYIALILLAVATGLTGWVALKAFLGLLAGLTLLATLAVVLLGWWTDLSAVRVARQEMLSGNTTYEKLREALGDLGSDFDISDCLDKESLPSEN